MKLALKYKNANSPSYNAFKKGNKTEIYYLNGWITRRMERYELDLPYNSAAMKMISEIEKGKLEPARKNLKDIFRKSGL
jgi:ketopantoate reductase